VVSASGDKTLRLWDVETGEELRTLKGHTGEVMACVFSPDGAQVVSASGGADKSLKLWDADTGEELCTLAGHTDWVRACAFSPDGARVLSASKGLKLWDADTGEELHSLEDYPYFYDCDYSPDGARVVSGGWDGVLKVWNPETGEELRSLKGHTDDITACAFSPDGARVVSVSEDRTLRLWDVATGECMATLPLLYEARRLAQSPVRASVACDQGGSVLLVDFVGVALGPLVVTAVDLGNGPAVRCPVCFETHPLQEAWLGQELDCPGRACHARLRVNPFIAGQRVSG